MIQALSNCIYNKIVSGNGNDKNSSLMKIINWALYCNISIVSMSNLEIIALKKY